MKDYNRNESNSKAVGILYATGAFSLWGILPLYWKALSKFSAGIIFSHRIFWSFIFIMSIIIFKGRLTAAKMVIKNKKKMMAIMTSSMLISLNWFLYIWAVNSGHIVEASLGYYINPLISVLLGVLVLKERLNRGPLIAIFVAVAGVLVATVEYGKFPWIAISLAVSFGLYGLVKKVAGVASDIGLALETAFVAPLALVYIIMSQGINGSFIHLDMTSMSLLILSGVVTALPLLWFTKGAQLIPLTTLGFIQYLAPSISLMIGIFVFGEPFSTTDAVCFGLIWCSILIFSLSQYSFKINQSSAVQEDKL